MLTVGEKLKEGREKLGLSLEEAEEELRIREKYLRALEENDFERLPGANYIHGFVKNYSRLLQLNEEKMLALFRRQYERHLEQKIVPTGDGEGVFPKRFKITPQRAALGAAALVLIVFFAILFLQYRKIDAPGEEKGFFQPEATLTEQPR